MSRSGCELRIRLFHFSKVAGDGLARFSERPSECRWSPVLLSRNGRRSRCRGLFEAAFALRDAASSTDKRRRSLERSTVLWGFERREPAACGDVYTGHCSSFHAISQNIHSYRELITNASSILRFSAAPASFTHRSTLARIHSWTAANSGEA